MKYLIFLSVLTFVIISCKPDNAASIKESEVEHTPAISNSKDPLVINTMKLLQGTWNSLDEKAISLTFENNTRIESKDGKKLSKLRFFELADECKNDTVKGKRLLKSKAKYISMLDIDMCYYIKKITKTELVLSYVGRNSTLRYIKEGKLNKKY